MDVQFNKENNSLRAAVTGELSGEDASRWSGLVMDQMTDEVDEVVLNLAGVTYLTSTALRGIILLQKELDKRDGDLIIEDPQEAVMEILDLVGMASFLEIRKTSE